MTSLGRLIRLGVLEIPALPPSAHSPGLSGGAPISEFVGLESGETVVGLAAADAAGAGLALGTAGGVVKRVAPDYPRQRHRLRGDRAQGRRPGGRRGPAGQRGPGPGVHHQRRPAAAVRRGGRCGRRAAPRAGWRAIRLSARASRGLVRRRHPGRGRRRAGGDGKDFPGGDPAGGPVVVTVAGAAGALPGTGGGDGEGHPVPGVPGQGPRDRRGALPPVPQGRGRAGAGLGRARRRPAARPTPGCRWTCPRPTAAGTAPGSGSGSR